MRSRPRRTLSAILAGNTNSRREANGIAAVSIVSEHDERDSARARHEHTHIAAAGLPSENEIESIEKRKTHQQFIAEAVVCNHSEVSILPSLQKAVQAFHAD